MSSLQRTILWSCLPNPGSEYFNLWQEDDGWRLGVRDGDLRWATIVEKGVEWRMVVRTQPMTVLSPPQATGLMVFKKIFREFAAGGWKPSG